MRTKMVYDLPTRIFHWSFVFLFLSSFIIAKNVDDESIVFAFHMLSGLLLGFLVIWRIFWGFFGSEHARFIDFSLNPKDLVQYTLGVFTNSKKRWPGHNPASSWSTIVMLILAFGLALTGYLMGSGLKEEIEDIHELMANSFLIVVVMHVIGVAIHSFQHRDSIALSMLDGKKDLSSEVSSIPNSRGIAATFLVVFMIVVASYLISNFDSNKGTLDFFGRTLTLGEGSGAPE
ncbi:cytochrome b [Bdellovibrio bacteriovorus]|uniref:Cytochrome b n=1 Tax=Bdellovibrio bacteriovorus TaxID=959 RepID=A0A150WQ58_BDEBC|nr:cytochrome b/b6 domain-containing protein [Bdellovibrio bacteriovorus]KYG66464.1 cytochrome b [Bdellovibrio bacteriovorus]